MYVVCEELINNQRSGCYTIRVESDCCSSRFFILGTFKTYEAANNYIHKLKGIHIQESINGV